MGRTCLRRFLWILNIKGLINILPAFKVKISSLLERPKIASVRKYLWRTDSTKVTHKVLHKCTVFPPMLAILFTYHHDRMFGTMCGDIPKALCRLLPCLALQVSRLLLFFIYYVIELTVFPRSIKFVHTLTLKKSCRPTRLNTISTQFLLQPDRFLVLLLVEFFLI